MASSVHPHTKKSQENKGFPLNSAQKAAAEAPALPLLIVAGAGTGKTKTLVSRIAHLIETGTPPERICAITFTNKAAQEMKERSLRAVRERTRRPGEGAAGAGTGRGEPVVATFHALGARILRKEYRALGRTANFAIFDDHDSFDLIKKVIKGYLTKEKSKKDTPAFFAQKISEMKNLDDALLRMKESAERKMLIQAVFNDYETALARNNAFDFDDLIEKPVTLFKKVPAARARYQQKFDAVLVDEYQDINPKQYELVKLLAEGHRNVSVVGDDEQTIYSWRYADIRTFLDFEKSWPGAKIYFLEENYRSTGIIIRAAAAVAANNKYRTPKTLRTANPEGERVTLFEAWGENDEAEWVAEEAENIRARGAADAGAEVAILYRTNAQSRALEQALIRRNVPYRIFGGLKFYERREVKDVMAALRCAANDRDEIARERLMKNLSKRKFPEFQEKIAAMREVASAETARMKPADIIKIFLEIYGYFDYLEGNFLNADERQENIAELVNFASGFAELPDFLEKVTLLQSTDDEAAHNRDPRAAVVMMTIHLAKGLEFDNVFIAGAAEGLLPHIRSIDNELSLEEERRLMYVAMTRAKKKLHVSFYGMPSRFIAEIPEECVALAGMPADDADGAARAGGRGRGEENFSAQQRRTFGVDEGDTAWEDEVIEF